MPRLAFASTKNSDMRYAVRVEIPDPFFLLELDGRSIIFLDHREYGVFADANRNPAIELVLVNPLLEAAGKIAGDTAVRNKLALHILREYGLTDAEIEVPVTFPLDTADFLRAQGVTLRPQHPYHPERLRKTTEERAAIRESLRRTQEAFHRIEEILREATVVGDMLRYRDELLTSELLKREAEEALFDVGMFNVEGIIISSGPHAAIPHHRGRGPITSGQTIICDIFPLHRESGYFADMTRTYVKGQPSPELARMYAAVAATQELAIAAVRPGVLGRAVHEVSCATFRELGYHVGDRGFVHGTGHGLGLDIHEEPYLAATGAMPLEVGHVVTVEPGLYYPELGGVRIEDVVIVTASGCENLTDYPKSFVIA